MEQSRDLSQIQPPNSAHFRLNDFLERMETRLKAFQPLIYGDRRNLWEDLMTMWPSEEPGLRLWEGIEGIIKDWIGEELEKLSDTQLLDLWLAEAPFGWEDEIDWPEGKPECPSDEDAPRDAQHFFLIPTLWQQLLWRAESAAQEKQQRDEFREATWREPKGLMEEIGWALRRKAAHGFTSPAEMARLAQWIHVLNVVPDSWPKALGELTMRQHGEEDSNFELRLIYDGQELKIDARRTAGLGQQESSWESLLCGNSADEVSNGDPSEYQIGGYDLSVVCIGPTPDIPAAFWKR